MVNIYNLKMLHSRRYSSNSYIELRGDKRLKVVTCVWMCMCVGRRTARGNHGTHAGQGVLDLETAWRATQSSQLSCVCQCHDMEMVRSKWKQMRAHPHLTPQPDVQTEKWDVLCLDLRMCWIIWLDPFKCVCVCEWGRWCSRATLSHRYMSQ